MSHPTIFYTTDAKRDLVRLKVSNEADFSKALELGAKIYGDSVCIADIYYADDTVFVKPRGERASRFFCTAVLEGSSVEEALYWALNEEVDLPGIRTLLINLRAGWHVTLAVNAPDFA